MDETGEQQIQGDRESERERERNVLVGLSKWTREAGEGNGMLVKKIETFHLCMKTTKCKAL
jgi:hypothetical protein